MKALKKVLAPALSALTLLICACSSESAGEPEAPKPDEVVLTGGYTIEAPQEGGTVMLRFSTTKDWAIEIPRVQEHYNGVLEVRRGAAGEMAVPFTARPNTTGEARSTTLRITSGRASAEITVEQGAVEVELPSEEEVRQYLVKLYNDIDGPNWRYGRKWCSDLPINQWGTEIKYENGRLSLILGEREIKGDIDLSGCKALVSIRCSKNQIGRLNLADCPLLTEVECVNTGLEELDISGCISLRRLLVSYNSLSSVDVGWCKALEDLNVSNCRIESLDLSECVSMKSLNCAVNRLTRLEVPHRYNLNDLFCYENELTRLDVSNSPQLSLINCGDNELEELNVRGVPKLSRLYCYNNRLARIDLSDQKDVLSQFYCYTNRLESLDLSGYRKLSELHCSDNSLTSLNITGCRQLHWLYCSYNRLESLDFTGLDLDIFERLDCSFNRLRQADLTSLRLMRLWCQGNRIGGEIPLHFDSLLEFEHDQRYDYRPSTGTYTDRGYGWWYPGEPDKLEHTR